MAKLTEKIDNYLAANPGLNHWAKFSFLVWVLSSLPRPSFKKLLRNHSCRLRLRKRSFLLRVLPANHFLSHLNKYHISLASGKPFFSFEYFPPKTDSGTMNLYERTSQNQKNIETIQKEGTIFSMENSALAYVSIQIWTSLWDAPYFTLTFFSQVRALRTHGRAEPDVDRRDVGRWGWVFWWSEDHEHDHDCD